MPTNSRCWNPISYYFHEPVNVKWHTILLLGHNFNNVSYCLVEVVASWNETLDRWHHYCTGLRMLTALCDVFFLLVCSLFWLLVFCQSWFRRCRMIQDVHLSILMPDPAVLTSLASICSLHKIADACIPVQWFCCGVHNCWPKSSNK